MAVVSLDVAVLEALRDMSTRMDILVAEVTGLRTGQRALAGKLDALLDSTPVATGADIAFLLAIAGSVGGCVFSAAQLCEHARVDNALRQVLAGQSVLQIGRRLRALAGRAVGGFLVQRVKRDAAGIVWCVVVANDLHAVAGAGDRNGAR